MVADREVVALARNQHGTITHRQLVLLGHTRASIRHRVASGWLRRVHIGVYAVGAVEAPLAWPMAAVLALGDGALLSHYPSSVLWGMRHAPAQTQHVTVVARNVRGPASVHVHRVEYLHPSDARSRHGIPTTSPARTLLDLATQALKLEPAFTRSKGGRLLLALVKKARLPHPVTNTHLHGYEIDHLWPGHKLIVEVDGYDVHSTRAAFENDRRRDAELQALGYRVLRITWRQLTEEPDAVIANLSAALARS